MTPYAAFSRGTELRIPIQQRYGASIPPYSDPQNTDFNGTSEALERPDAFLPYGGTFSVGALSDILNLNNGQVLHLQRIVHPQNIDVLDSVIHLSACSAAMFEFLAQLSQQHDSRESLNYLAVNLMVLDEPTLLFLGSLGPERRGVLARQLKELKRSSSWSHVEQRPPETPRGSRRNSDANHLSISSPSPSSAGSAGPHPCPSKDCNYKPGGYKYFGSLRNHVQTKHASMLDGPEWEEICRRHRGEECTFEAMDTSLKINRELGTPTPQDMRLAVSMTGNADFPDNTANPSSQQFNQELDDDHAHSPRRVVASVPSQQTMMRDFHPFPDNTSVVGGQWPSLNNCTGIRPSTDLETANFEFRVFPPEATQGSTASHMPQFGLPSTSGIPQGDYGPPGGFTL